MSRDGSYGFGCPDCRTRNESASSELTPERHRTTATQAVPVAARAIDNCPRRHPTEPLD